MSETTYQGSRTWIEIDRKTGRIRVYRTTDGKLIDELYVKPCPSAS